MYSALKLDDSEHPNNLTPHEGAVIYILLKEKKHIVNVPNVFATIDFLKDAIFTVTQVPVQQRLIFSGKVLNDPTKCLLDLKINSGDTLHLFPKSDATQPRSDVDAISSAQQPQSPLLATSIYPHHPINTSQPVDYRIEPTDPHPLVDVAIQENSRIGETKLHIRIVQPHSSY